MIFALNFNFICDSDQNYAAQNPNFYSVSTKGCVGKFPGNLRPRNSLGDFCSGIFFWAGQLSKTGKEFILLNPMGTVDGS